MPLMRQRRQEGTSGRHNWHNCIVTAHSAADAVGKFKVRAIGWRVTTIIKVKEVES